MAKSINNVILLGRLTRDPELRTTTSGKNIAEMSLAVDRGNDEADFFEVTAWEKTAELVSKYTHKGSKVLVQGRLRQDSWDDKETGKKRSKVVVVANDVTFLDSVSDAKSAQTSDVVPTDIPGEPVDLSKISIPF